MSWWWMAPLGIGIGGAGLLAVVGRRLAAEAVLVGRSTTSLAAMRPRLLEARRRLVVDGEGQGRTETRPAPR